MRILPLVRAEFARLTSSRLGKLSVAAIMIVPLVYGGLYLWGNQDPYKNLDHVPAALVVADTGTTVDASDGSTEAVNYGQDAADELLDDGTFGWHVVSAAAAASGVVDGTYDFAITFPSSFSADLASASDDDPTQAQLKLTTNDTNSYLSTTLAKQAAATVRAAIAANVGEKATATLLSAVADIRDGLSDASDGASELADGATDAATGASSLADGLSTLSSGAATLADGTATLDDGAHDLADGSTSVATGAKSLSTGLATLDASTSSLPTSTKALSDGAGAVSTGAAQLAASVPTLQSSIAQVMAAYGVPAATAAKINAGMQSLSTGSTALSTGAAQVASGASTLNSAAPALASGISSAADGAATLSTGAKKAAKGAARLADGTADVASGASKLANGANDAATGAATLSDGTTKLEDGATTLSDKLGDAVDEVPAQTHAEQDDIAAAVADPVEVDQTALTEADNYGAGLAPFFISLAAWIGIYALFLLVRPLSRRALTAVRRPVPTMLAGWATPAVLGAVQMVGLFALVTLALHLAVANGLGLLAFMIFVSITFAAIVLALNVLLGSVGQFLGLILMIVQLVTAGGTFPWQTLPAPLAALHYALPMGHAVDGVRQLMYGGSADAVWAASWPLALWLVGALVVAALGAAKQGRLRTLRELRPSAIGG